MKKLILTLAAVSFSISGCILTQPEYHDYTYPENYDESMYGAVGNDYRTQQREVSTSPIYQPRYQKIPSQQKTYQFSKRSGPRSHKDRDAEWVTSQPGSNYTIEVGSGENAANVARLLHKSPKSQRRAQVRLQNSDNYTGLIGSYSSEAEAQKALSELPDEVKSKAKVNRWNNVKTEVATKRPEPVQNSDVINTSNDEDY